MELEQKRKQEIREQETAKESKETKEKISLLEMELKSRDEEISRLDELIERLQQEVMRLGRESREETKTLQQYYQISQNLLQRIHEVEGKNVDLMLQLKELNSTSSYPLEKSTSLKKFNFYHS
eukprot:Sdes_comp19281_c0_seq1m10301